MRENVRVPADTHVEVYAWRRRSLGELWVFCYPVVGDCPRSRITIRPFRQPGGTGLTMGGVVGTD